jgi:hypothetical protein
VDATGGGSAWANTELETERKPIITKKLGARFTISIDVRSKSHFKTQQAYHPERSHALFDEVLTRVWMPFFDSQQFATSPAGVSGIQQSGSCFVIRTAAIRNFAISLVSCCSCCSRYRPGRWPACAHPLAQSLPGRMLPTAADAKQKHTRCPLFPHTITPHRKLRKRPL